MGGPGSGSKLGVPRGEYFTRGKQRELELWEAERERRLADQRKRAEERTLERARKRSRARRDRLKAAGLPLPRGGKDKAGASTVRMRRLRERRRILLEAWNQALKENRRRDRRVARGLPAAPKTSTQRARECLERKATKHAVYLEYLRLQCWFSPAVSPETVQGWLEAKEPGLHSSQYIYRRAMLEQECAKQQLNLNAFTVAEGGIEKAVLQRAIFYEMSRDTLKDLSVVLKEAEDISSLKDVPSIAALHTLPEGYTKNAINDAMYYAPQSIGNGDGIYLALTKGNKQ